MVKKAASQGAWVRTGEETHLIIQASHGMSGGKMPQHVGMFFKENRHIHDSWFQMHKKLQVL